MRLNLKNIILSLCVSVFICGLMSQSLAFAGQIDGIKVLKISARDQRAVIKTSDGKMKIIKAGDVIGENVKVIEVVDGRIVFEEKIDKEVQTVIIRINNSEQKIERIRKTIGGRPEVYAPQPMQKIDGGQASPSNDKKKKAASFN